MKKQLTPETAQPKAKGSKSSSDDPKSSTPVDFDSIYFDTCVLRQANWPNLSGLLQQILSLARTAKKAVVIPEVVFLELESQSATRYREALKLLSSATARVKSVLGDVGLTGSTDLRCPCLEEVQKGYQAVVTQLLAKWGINRCALPSMDLSTLVRRAVYRELAFKDEGKGFQDTIIFLSVVLDLQARQQSKGLLVSADSIFEERRDSLINYATAAGVNLNFCSSLQGLDHHLRRIVSSEIQNALQRREQAAIRSLESYSGHLQRWLRDSVEAFNWHVQHRLGIGIWRVSDIRVGRAVSHWSV